MSVTRYDVNGPSSVFEDVNGSLVDFKDYAALEDKRAALAEELKQSKIDADCYKKGMEASNARLVQLAAENAGLKDACGGDGSYRDCPACAHSEYIEAPETPATDAFLAEVRAQGVEMLKSHLNNWMSDMNFPSDMQFEHSEFIQACDDFAAQLRKEDAQ